LFIRHELNEATAKRHRNGAPVSPGFVSHFTVILFQAFCPTAENTTNLREAAFARKHALASTHCGKIAKNTCARFKVHLGFDYGSFSVRLVFIEGWFSRYDGLVWGLFAIGLGFV
jgi:hypothetical protein